MKTMSSGLARMLSDRQLPSGGWSFNGSPQAGVEATCLGCLALAWEAQGSTRLAIQFLLGSQLADGGWPAFEGDSEGSWVTALCLSTLIAQNEASQHVERALKWLL